MFLGFSAYFWLLGLTIVFPLAFRIIHPVRPLDENYRALFLAILLSTVLFGAWDVWAVWRGHWDFNSAYVWDWRWGLLPVEEWLFYPVVAFASMFIRIKYLAACGGVRNTVSGPGLALGFDTNRGPTKWGFIWSVIRCYDSWGQVARSLTYHFRKK